MNTKEALIQIGADWDMSKCVLAWMFKEELHTGKVERNPEALLQLIGEMYLKFSLCFQAFTERQEGL